METLLSHLEVRARMRLMRLQTRPRCATSRCNIPCRLVPVSLAMSPALTSKKMHRRARGLILRPYRIRCRQQFLGAGGRAAIRQRAAADGAVDPGRLLQHARSSARSAAPHRRCAARCAAARAQRLLHAAHGGVCSSRQAAAAPGALHECLLSTYELHGRSKNYFSQFGVVNNCSNMYCHGPSCCIQSARRAIAAHPQRMLAARARIYYMRVQPNDMPVSAFADSGAVTGDSGPERAAVRGQPQHSARVRGAVGRNASAPDAA